MLVTLENFDWSITERELVIFMPSWGRKDFVRRTVEVMETNVSRDRWIIIVGNDCQHEDLSCLRDQNVFYFTFSPGIERKQERGGGYIRNIAIKKCRSKWFFQRDPEVIIENDYINNIINCPTDFYRLSGPGYRVRQHITEKFMDGQASIEDCKSDSQLGQIIPGHFVFFNMAFAVKTKILQDMRGYDEDHWGTYVYDRDLHFRLMAQGLKETIDPQCKPIHLWHPTPSFPNTNKTKCEYEDMKQIFNTKDPKNYIRNIGKDWGEGGNV